MADNPAPAIWAAYRARAEAELGMTDAKDGTPAMADSAVSGDPTPIGDIANGKRLVRLYGDRIRYTAERGWMVYDGQRWAADASGQMMALAKEAANSIFGELPGIASESEQRALFKWALQSRRLERLRAAIVLAESEPGIPARLACFDADPLVINVANGTIDLKTGELRPHRREDLHSRIVPIAYDPAAACPTWERFLDRVMPDPDTRAYLRRAIGYSLTGLTGEQCLFFAYGTGANGKGTVLNTLQALTGEYATASRVETFAWRATGGGVPNDIAALAGARVVVVSEVDEGQRLNESLVKDMTGGDAISARFLNREYFTFRAQFKLWMQGNHKPQIRGTDHGIWRRIHLIPFGVTIPDDEKDLKLFDKLKAELPGILAWAVRGCLEWQREGLRPPEAVTAATAEYRAEMDVLGAFLEERCVLAPNATVRAKELYDAYRAWCEESGQGAYSQTRLGRAMAERGIPKEKDRDGWFYRGLGLLVTGVTGCDPFSRNSFYISSRVETFPKKCSQLVTPVTDHEKGHQSGGRLADEGRGGSVRPVGRTIAGRKWDAQNGRWIDETDLAEGGL